MERSNLSLAEIEILGTLIRQNGTIVQRTELVRALDHYAFVEPEHRIVFESIRSLLPRDRFSAEHLAVHLNNRGFPDVDLDKYIAAGSANVEHVLRIAARLNPSGQERMADTVSNDLKSKS